MIKDSFIQIDELKIHIRSSGQGQQVIFFVHGNSCSAEFWDDQLNDPSLQKHFKLIAVDLPGHGSSDKSKNYSIDYLSKILILVIENLSLGNYIMAGLSYGTALIAEAALGLTHCKGFFLTSPNITSDQYPPTSYIVPFPELLTMISESVEENMLKRFAAHLTNDPLSPLIKKFSKSYKDTDPRFRVELGTEMQNAAWSDEFSNLIKTGVPVKYIYGERELAMNIHYMDSIKLPSNHSSSFLQEAAHFVNNDQCEKYNELLVEFSKRVFL